MSKKSNCSKSGLIFAASNPGVGETGPSTPICPPDPPQPSDNEIFMFKTSECGKLHEIDREKTGGVGTGPGLTFCEDPLGTQGSICISSDKKFLFVVNAGDVTNGTNSPVNGTVSSMRVYHDKIKQIETVDAGGVFPGSCTSFGNLLYVLNCGADTNLVAFQIKEDGKLENLGVKATFGFIPMANGQPAFFALVANPAQVRFTPDGKKIVVSVKEFTAAPDSPRGSLYVFDVQPNGDLTNMVRNTSVGYLPWSFEINGKYLVVTEIFGQNPPSPDPTDKGALSSYLINNDNTLTTITTSLPSKQTASCWVSRSDQYLYVSNSRSIPGSITSYKIKDNGELVLLESVAYQGNTHILDSITMNGYLYLLCPGSLELPSGPVSGSIRVLKINKHDGTLKLKQTLNVFQPLAGASGIVALKL